MWESGGGLFGGGGKGSGGGFDSVLIAIHIVNVRSIEVLEGLGLVGAVAVYCKKK